jgi:hypothetical protein
LNDDDDLRHPLKAERAGASGPCIQEGLGETEMTAVEMAISPLSETERGTQLRRALIASTVGTTIEWYDFLLYGQVTGLVFGKLFFPQSDPLVGVLQAFPFFSSALSAGRSGRRSLAIGEIALGARRP